MRSKLLLSVWLGAAAALVVACGNSTPLVTLETVAVGDANNAADPKTGYGAVPYEFSIGKYLVTIGQYVAFLNATATVTADQAIIDLWNEDMESPASYVSGGFVRRTGSGTDKDPYVYSEMVDPSLGNDSERRAMPNIAWFSAARFANWIHNGATKGADTETGAYTLNHATSGVFLRNPGARWWVPSEDEWYKAAYFDPTLAAGGGYWEYPTRSNTRPVKEPPPGLTAGGVNSANYDKTMPDLKKITPVGAYPNSKSHYGLFDQAGLLWQWNDATYADGTGKPLNRGIRGGSWSLGRLNVSRLSPRDYPPDYQDDDSGFRLATVKQ